MVNGVFQMEPTTDLEAVWKEMEKQVDAGLVKSIGVSNYTPTQLDRIMKIARVPPTNNQVSIVSLYNRFMAVAALKSAII